MENQINMNTDYQKLEELFNSLGEVEESDEESDEELFVEEYTTESLESKFETGQIDEETYDRLIVERACGF